MRLGHIRIPKSPKSSPDARRLLEAIYKQEGSWQKVANRLGLTNRAVAWQMSKGVISDTTEMKIALKLARRRSRMAFAGLKLPKEPIDIRHEIIKDAVADVRRALSKLRTLTEDANGSNDTAEATNS